MRIESHFPLELLYGFLLTLARVGSAFAFLPIPGFQGTPVAPRVVLTVGVTFCLSTYWPHANLSGADSSVFVGAVLTETIHGLVLGVAIAFLAETFQLAAQFISLQTGFSFASTFDPSSQADTGIFQVLSQLAVGFLFFSFGIHRELIRMIAISMVRSPWPAGVPVTSAWNIIPLGANLFITSLRLALPAIALLLLTDICLVVISRIQTQVQLLHLSFPAKIVLSLFFVSLMLTRWPRIYQTNARDLLERTAQLMAQ
jgi:flagellar biosynthetic protein FliR